MDPARYYDSYVDRQVRSGINERIHGLYRKVRSHGLRTDSRVLEIGCGIGALTSLLCRRVHRGIIEAIDISPASVAFAKQHLPASRVCLYVADIREYQPKAAAIDAVLLFDVLEHIPSALHGDVLGRIAGWMHEGSFLYINIPNPDYILWDRKHRPESLQETDEPVRLQELSAVLDAAGLEILCMETWSVWAKEDYRFFVIRKKRPFTEVLLAGERGFFSKVRNVFLRQWRRFRYPFPR